MTADGDTPERPALSLSRPGAGLFLCIKATDSLPPGIIVAEVS